MKIDFEFETVHGMYRDALYLEDGHGLTEEQVEQLKQERVNKWIDFIENPPALERDTVEIDGIVYEKVNLNGQIVLKPF